MNFLIDQVFDFLNLSSSEGLINTISDNISRKNKSITSTDDKILHEIGGEILTGNELAILASAENIPTKKSLA